MITLNLENIMWAIAIYMVLVHYTDIKGFVLYVFHKF